MKYLSKRDEFIKKSINKINEYKSYDDLEPLNEAESGPFANDIPWGNSLVGRLVNRIVRNAKKGADLVRIKSVIRKLQDAMDDILDGPAQVALNSEENKEELHRFITFSFIASLEKAVKDGEDVKIIINLTKEAIEEIKKYEDVDNKDSLIGQLEEFLKFLEGLKDDKGEEPKKEEEKSEDTGVKEEFYQNTVKLLKSTISICDVIKNKKITYDKPAVNKQTATQPTTQQTQQPVKAEVKEPAKETVTESLFYENESLPIFESKLEANETKAINAWMKVEKSYASSGIGNMVARMQDLIKNSESGENMELYKKTISKIGYQVISNEQTIGKNLLSLDSLVKEELNPDSENDIPKAISLLGNVILAFKGDLGLASQLIEANQPIKDFISSYDKLKELLPKLKAAQESAKKEENKEEVKKESKLLRYNGFISINEADEEKPEDKKSEDKDEEVSDPVVMTTVQKIQDYWDKKIDVKAFTMERTEVTKMEKKFDKIAEDQDKEKFWIYDIDPIIEVVKCFNRAYKLHTTPVIPNVGTTDGRVSASTFAQYTPFGGGNKMNAGLSGGPYRNNAIFDQWENAVLDIIKGTKYQKIFRKEVVIKTKDGNEIPNAGANLRKFMTDMLDGDTLYKSGGQGKQAEFLDKYFGWKGDEKSLTIGNDASDNSKTADQIKTKDLGFTNNPIKFEKNEDLKNSFFAVSTNDNKQLYFYIQALQNGNFYVSYSRSMFFFNKYIEVGAKISTKLAKGDLPFDVNKSQSNQDGKDYVIYGFKIKPESLIGRDGKFLLSGKYELSPVINYEEGKNKAPKSKLADKFEIDIKSVFTLKETTKEDDKDVSKRFVLEKVGNSISTYGGFTNIVGSSDIEKTSIVKK
jgi:hypothetical protein